MLELETAVAAPHAGGTAALVTERVGAAALTSLTEYVPVYPQDAAVTRRLVTGGELLGIEVLDHVIIGDGGRWCSMKERGLYQTKGIYAVGHEASR